METKKLVLWIGFILFVLNLNIAFSAEIIPFNYKAECTTEGTKITGERKDCYSSWSPNQLPAGFVFNKDSMTTSYESNNGSENRCEFKWSNEVEIIPGAGIKLPTNVEIRAYARSPKHQHGARGWSKCVFKGNYTKYN